MSHHILLKNARRQLQRIEVQDPIHPSQKNMTSNSYLNNTQTLYEQRLSRSLR
jgi:hypothetical protein